MQKKKIKFLFINFLIIVLALEILSRIFFYNEYSQNKGNYLHQPNRNIEFKIDKLYENSETEIILKTDNLGGIVNKVDEQEFINYEIIALGGSTLESALVQFGHRWNDVTNFNIKNFGKSRLRSAHNIVNLEYILRNNKKIKTVFIMDSVNNFHYFLNNKSSLNELESSQIKNKILSNFYLISIFYNAIKKNNYKYFYEIQRKIFERKENITDKEINYFWKQNSKKLLILEERILKNYFLVANRYQVELIFILQPHGYNKSYTQNKNDLRTNFLIENKKLNDEQSFKIIDKYYKNLINIYSKQKIVFFNAEFCINKKNLYDLFYDRYHFTKKGSKAFANCLDRFIKNHNLKKGI